MERHELTPLVEALLFAVDQPLTVGGILKAIGDDTVEKNDVKAALESLRENYDAHPRGFELVRFGNGWQVLTRSRYGEWIDAMLKTKRKARLSRAALETAAVVAYKQPISRVEIERVRGVDSGAVLATLLERELIMIKGRDPGPGRALLYGTTGAFLEYFGLSSVADLPRLDELAALAGVEREALTDKERERLERHGIDLESITTPAGLLHDGPEGDAAAAEESFAEEAIPEADSLAEAAADSDRPAEDPARTHEDPEADAASGEGEPEDETPREWAGEA